MTSTQKSLLPRISFQIICALIALISLYPVFWMISSSFKESARVFAESHSLLPQVWNFSNYARGWKGFAGISFATFFTNTIVIVLLSTLGALLSCSLIAYGFARIKFRFKGFWFATVMVTMLLPSQIVLIPQYIIFYKMHWINTILPLVVPTFFGSAFFIFLIMQFIRTIPYELDESAKMDGSNRFGIYLKIIIPLIVPALVTSAIFEFYWTWDKFYEAMIYLGQPKMYTVSIALRMFADPSSQTDWSAMFAMASLSLLPPITVFFIFQRYIVDGISTTGLKG
ncbi:carbohydrate ABC transporter permease [Paenibacillus sp. LjRoot153]|uniref:carbohydrate ABC transporter permease n=1 Tax=Paenibacillus sp. LjRoot153 TaxID=3342270 RepID=UPI003ECCB132